MSQLAFDLNPPEIPDSSRKCITCGRSLEAERPHTHVVEAVFPSTVSDACFTVRVGDHIETRFGMVAVTDIVQSEWRFSRKPMLLLYTAEWAGGSSGALHPEQPEHWPVVAADREEQQHG